MKSSTHTPRPEECLTELFDMSGVYTRRHPVALPVFRVDNYWMKLTMEGHTDIRFTHKPARGCQIGSHFAVNIELLANSIREAFSLLHIVEYIAATVSLGINKV